MSTMQYTHEKHTGRQVYTYIRNTYEKHLLYRDSIYLHGICAQLDVSEDPMKILDWKPNQMHLVVYGFVRTYEAREGKSDADPTHCQINTCKTTQTIRSSKQSQPTRKFCVGFLTGLCIDKERVRL